MIVEAFGLGLFISTTVGVVKEYKKRKWRNQLIRQYPQEHDKEYPKGTWVCLVKKPFENIIFQQVTFGQNNLTDLFNTISKDIVEWEFLVEDHTFLSACETSTSTTLHVQYTVFYHS